MLSNRKKRFLAAAIIVGGDQFDWCAVASKLGIADDEAQDIAIALANEGYVDAIAYGDSVALLTPEGRDAARDAIEQGFGDGINA